MAAAHLPWSTLREGHGDDAVALAALVNRAYVVEAPFIRGERTTPAGIHEAMANGVFLVAEDENGAMQGCVYATANGEHGSFGMLSVDPAIQGAGLGRRLVRAAEAWLAGHDCRTVTIQVVSTRDVLVPWYGTMGYAVAGSEPFVQPERLKMPVHFILMTRELPSQEAGA